MFPPTTFEVKVMEAVVVVSRLTVTVAYGPGKPEIAGFPSPRLKLRVAPAIELKLTRAITVTARTENSFFTLILPLMRYETKSYKGRSLQSSSQRTAGPVSPLSNHRLRSRALLAVRLLP